MAGESETHNDHHGDQFVIPLLFIWMALFIGYAVRYFSRKFGSPLPYTVMLMVIGTILAALNPNKINILGLYGDSVDAVVHIDPHIILHVFLPALIFESAFNVNFHILWREMGQALVLAGPGVLISTVLSALVAGYVLPYDWSLAYSVLFGAIISATDPVAVVATLKELGASKRLNTLIEAESLFNDGVAFVLFIIVLDFVEMNTDSPSAGEIVSTTIRLSLGGVALGLAFGFSTATILSHVFNDSIGETVITIFTCYLVFWVAEGTKLHVSGVLAVVTMGVYLAKNRAVISPHIEENLMHVWEMIGYMANTIIFILSGVIAGDRMFSSKYLEWKDLGYLILLYILLQIIRFVTIGVCIPILRMLGYGFSMDDWIISSWGGLRGAVGLSLALIVEGNEQIYEADRDELTFHVCGIVALSLAINGSTMSHVLAFLNKYSNKDEQKDIVYNQAVQHLRNEQSKLMLALKQDEQYSGADWVNVRSNIPNYISNKTQSQENEETKKEDNDDDDILEPGKYSGGNKTVTEKEMDQLMQQVMNESNHKKRKELFAQIEKLAHRQVREMQREEELIQEVHRRMIMSIKASLWKQYDEGKTTRKALSLLVEACENALDTNDFEAIYRSIKPCIIIPKVLREVDNWMSERETILYSRRLWKHCNYLLRNVLFDHLSLGVDIAMAFIASTERVKDHLMITFPEIHVNEMSGVINNILEEVELLVERVRTYWMDVRMSYPEVYRAIQTRQSAQCILFHSRENVEHLLMDGLLEESEAEKLVHTVEKHMHTVLNTSACAVKLRSGRAILHELPFLTHLGAEKRAQILGNCKKRSYDSGDIILPCMSHSSYVSIVVRGVIDIYSRFSGEKELVESVDVGREIALWHVLSGQPYRFEAKARGLVEVYRFSKKLIHHLIQEDIEINQRLWKMTASRLLRMNFHKEFWNLDQVAITNMCENATLIYVSTNVNIKDCKLRLNGTALLLKGSLFLDPNQKVDAFTPPEFTADVNLAALDSVKSLERKESNYDHDKENTFVNTSSQIELIESSNLVLDDNNDDSEREDPNNKVHDLMVSMRQETKENKEFTRNEEFTRVSIPHIEHTDIKYNGDDGNTVHAPTLLYPTQGDMQYQFSNDAVLLIFRANDIMQARVEEQQVQQRQQDLQLAVSSSALLIDAASAGNVKQMDRLIQSGINPSHADYDGRTPLMLACAEGRLAVVPFLVEQHKVDVNTADNYGNTALTEALKNDNERVVKYLVKKGAVLDSNLATEWLLEACHIGRYKRVKVLLGAGADVNCYDYDKRSPLMFAVCSGHRKIVKLLREHGAEVTQKDRWGRTAIDDAKFFKQNNIVSILKNKKKYHGRMSPDDDQNEDLDALVSPVFPQKEMDEEDESSILSSTSTLNIQEACLAASEGKLEDLKKLKEKGISLTDVDYDGRSPLHLAALNGHDEVVAFLLQQNDVNVNVIDRFHMTPLADALNHGRVKCVNLLRKAGGTVVNSNIATKLCAAAAQGDLASLKKYVSMGVNLNVGDADLRTPLMLAACENQKKCVEFLLDSGAQLSKDRFGNTARSEAATAGHMDIVNLLDMYV